GRGVARDRERISPRAFPQRSIPRRHGHPGGAPEELPNASARSRRAPRDPGRIQNPKSKIQNRLADLRRAGRRMTSFQIPKPSPGFSLSRFLVSYPAGSKIYGEGEIGTEMFVIRSGEVEI